MITLAVAEADADTRVDAFVARKLGMSRSQAAALLADHRVTVDGHVVGKAQRLAAGTTVTVADADAGRHDRGDRDGRAASSAPHEPPVAPPVLYDDADLLVVDKPAGLVVHPGAGHLDDTLVDALVEAGLGPVGGDDPRRPGIVHRLDRGTSGVMMVARNETACAGLVAALAARQVARWYLALVVGRPSDVHGRIEGPIGRDPRDRTRFAVVSDGRPAVTRYTVVATAPVDHPTFREVSLLACRLETGRTHQIRVHMAAIGHGVLGDPVYGRGAALGRTLGIDRPALHAALLRLDHPSTGKPVEVFAPAPVDLASVCAGLSIEVPTSASALESLVADVEPGA